jgi:hypothetical protein
LRKPFRADYGMLEQMLNAIRDEAA